MVIPNFTDAGILPVGTYRVTADEIRRSHLLQGAEDRWYQPWDSTWRAQLLTNTELLATELWNAGVTRIFLDGSFVEAKAHPHDIDGYFECDVAERASGELERRLNTQNPQAVRTWHTASRRRAAGSTKGEP